jgi:lipoprotein-anchoring transpeptidase ErfK/SrfK
VKQQVMRCLCRRGIRLAGAALTVLALFLLSLPSAQLSRADSMAVSIPADIGANEHWVDVNISQQTLVVMDGSTAVRVVFVTTGGSGWDTPTGTFHVMRRVEDETMTSSSLGIPINSPGGYDLDHVMYTQYFTNEGHALHDNYWQPDVIFGSTPTSHGCVGMELADSKFLWDYLTVGSRIVIHS